MNAKLQAEIKTLAAQIMVLARDNLIGSLRYLNRAFFCMPMIASSAVKTFSVDGTSIRYNAKHVVKVSKKEKNYCSRAFLHMIFHCLFNHPFRYDAMNREYWNVACDIAVENAIMELDINAVVNEDDDDRQRAVSELKQKVPALTAEKIYGYMRENPREAAAITKYRRLFCRDDHKAWLKKDGEDGEGGGTKRTDTRKKGMSDLTDEDRNEGNRESVSHAFAKQMQQEWSGISRNAQTDMEAFSFDQGAGAGSLKMNLRAVLLEKRNYSDFLKKFTVMNEEMKINDEEFDYVYYTYGLDLYENIPLIEPLEYRESTKIRDFVIAIDTSGSCKGSTVRNFLDNTYSILRNNESFFEKINVHIIQCDSKIQNDTVITSEAEFEEYMKDVHLWGFGGTDFRPVFEYVDDLVKKKEFENLKGLIYFTDGRGIYPKTIPAYKTAFVFVENGHPIPPVPPWAIKQIYREEEMQ